MHPDPDRKVTVPPAGPATIDGLRNSLAEVISESKALRADVHTAEALRAQKIAQIRKESLLNLVILGGLALFMVIVLAVAYQNNQIAKDTKRNADTIVDCTTAGGKCYDEGRKRTGEAVGTLQRIQLYIIECSRALPVAQYPPGPKFDRLFESCVAAKVRGPGSPPTPGGN